jgi:hypothetical protein
MDVEGDDEGTGSSGSRSSEKAIGSEYMQKAIRSLLKSESLSLNHSGDLSGPNGAESCFPQTKCANGVVGANLRKALSPSIDFSAAWKGEVLMRFGRLTERIHPFLSLHPDHRLLVSLQIDVGDRLAARPFKWPSDGAICTCEES